MTTITEQHAPGKTRLLDAVETGAIILLNGPHAKRGWLVTARSDDYIVAVRQRAFHSKGENEYTVIFYSPYQYNGVGPGIIRSSLNTLGGGWDLDGRIDEGSREILEALESKEWFPSNRRRFPVTEWEVIP